MSNGDESKAKKWYNLPLVSAKRCTTFGHLVLYLEIIKPRLIAVLCR